MLAKRIDVEFEAFAAGRANRLRFQIDGQAITFIRRRFLEQLVNDLRVELAGGRIRIYLDGAKEPQIDHTDADPLKAGSVGFRTFQVQAAVRQIRLTRGEKTEDVPMEYVQPASTALTKAQDRALAELCKLILNLNEFVYID